MLDRVWVRIADFFTDDRIEMVIRAALILVVGLLVARLLSRLLSTLAKKSWNAEQAELVRRLVFYTASVIVVAWCVQQLGFDLTVVLGAAGIASVALGFASQTSLSNVISGFLLFGERPFKVGDVIEVSDQTGEVLAVNLISTTLRTFNNRFVRIPNEVMIKSTVVNLTRFPIRRLDLSIPIAHAENLDRVKRALLEAAELNPLCLEQPPPLFYITEYADSHVVAQYSVWCETGKWLAFLETMTTDVKRVLDRHEIRLPYPHRVVVSPPGG